MSRAITGAAASHNKVYVVENEVLSDRQLAKLKRLQDAILCQTAEFVQKEKKAGYQENLLKQMLGDVLEEV